jgi:protein HOOK3
MADMTLRNERLQDHNETLQSSLTIAEDKLSGAAKDGDAAAVIKNLESKIRDQEELIANQEGQIEQDRTEKARIRKDNDRLLHASNLVESLQDDLKELQHKNVELTKKANTLDRYKQKLEQQGDLEKLNKNLEYELEEANAQLKEFELLKRRTASLEATHIQYSESLGKRETEIFEMANQKKALDEERANLRQRVALLEERKDQDEIFINGLQQELNGKAQSVASPTGPSRITSLEDELEQSESSGNRNDFEISRLKAEIQILKGNAGAAQENASLRLELEDAERTRKHLAEKCQELFDKHVIATQQVDAVLKASTNEGLVKGINTAMLIGQLAMLTPEYYSSEAFSEIRKQQQLATDQVTSTTKKLRETEAELESTKRDLLSVTADCMYIPK